METFEHFYLRTLAKLQSERKHEKVTTRQRISPSFIYFHGRTVLSPLLSEKEREEMTQYRHRAARLQAERQTRNQNNLINQVQKILDNRVSAFTMPDPVGQPNKEQDVFASNRSISPLAEQKNINRKHGEKIERDDETGNEGISLQSLLQKSRDYIDKEQGQRGSKVHRRSPVSENNENDRASPVGETNSEPSCSVQSRSSISPDQAKTLTFKKPKSVSEAAHGLDSLSSYTPYTVLNTESVLSPRSPYTVLNTDSVLSPRSPHTVLNTESVLSPRSPHTVLNTESVLSPRLHRSRPLSTGNILLSYPVSPNEAARGIPQGCGPLASFERRLLEGEGGSGSRRASHSGSSPLCELGGIISASDSGRDHMDAGFRRRCYTLDSNLGPFHHSPPIDRSQERVPRFMAGVLQRTPTHRSPPAQLSPPFILESPTSPQLRSSLSPDLPTSSCHNKQHIVAKGNSVLGTMVDVKNTEGVQWQVQALEEIQRSLKEEHALQISLFMAEQEREQQHLSQELEEKDRQLRDPEGVSAVVGDIGGVLAPAIPPAVYLWGSNQGVNKPRNRLSQVLNAEQQKALRRLSAYARGFLTRRLLNTEKVKHLRQTVKDTQEFISSFHTEAPQKRSNFSNQDVSLQERVRAQLRAALFDIHDIFFEMTLDERLALLQQDRELRTERKLREMDKAKGPKEKIILSAATQKVLDRKKQRAGESPVQTRRVQQKPKSPLTSRSLQRRAPEDRVKRSDSLK